MSLEIIIIRVSRKVNKEINVNGVSVVLFDPSTSHL